MLTTLPNVAILHSKLSEDALIDRVLPHFSFWLSRFSVAVERETRRARWGALSIPKPDTIKAEVLYQFSAVIEASLTKSMKVKIKNH